MSVWLSFLLGGAALILGAELLVRGASRLAMAMGVSPLVVGLTVVAFGTSAPELAVTVGASVSGQADIAMGNVVGSNISNVLLILGLSALVGPLAVSQRLVRWEVPLVVAASSAAWLFALDGSIGRLEGSLLFAGIVVYTVFAIRQSRKASAAVAREYDGAFGVEIRRPTWVRDGLFVAAGLGLLVLGARWLVAAAVVTAEALGVSQLVIGLTVVAVGTSLPELATSLLAAYRGERDIAVGNVVGSNLFNLLAVLGLGSLLSPAGVPVARAALVFDLPVMIAVSVACLPIFFTGYRISRWEGALFVGYYAAYTGYLLLASAEHAALSAYGAALTYFALPLTAVTLAVLAYRSYRAGSIAA